MDGTKAAIIGTDLMRRIARSLDDTRVDSIEVA
jgi:hypothetical protein